MCEGSAAPASAVHWFLRVGRNRACLAEAANKSRGPGPDITPPNDLPSSLLHLPTAMQLYRPLLLAKVPQLELLDGALVTPEEREAAAAAAFAPAAPLVALGGTPFMPSGFEGGAAGMQEGGVFGGFVGAAGPGAAWPAGGALNVPAGPMAAAARRSCGGAGALPDKPAALESFASAAGGQAYSHALATKLGLALGGGGLWLAAPPPSVPSIQSSTVVFTGPSAFGLAGTALAGGGAAQPGSAASAGMVAAAPRVQGRGRGGAPSNSIASGRQGSTRPGGQRL